MANFDIQMCRAAAKRLISSLSLLQGIPVEESNIPDEIIAWIADLNLTQQDLLIQRANRYLSLTLDVTALQRQISEIEVLREERDLEDRFLLLGAPLRLMRRLFGMHAYEFSRRRKVLNIQGSGNGRPPSCTEETEHLVWNLWQSYQHSDERDRFMTIAEQTGLDLHIIWSALREHICEENSTL